MKATFVEHANYDPLLPTVDAARYLGVHEETLKTMARNREIACIRAAGTKSHLKFRLSALNGWANRHEVKPLRRVATFESR